MECECRERWLDYRTHSFGVFVLHVDLESFCINIIIMTF
jgi:hypothetical protein